VNQHQQWASVLSAAASAAVPDVDSALRTAMQLGLGIVPSATACSVTELTDSGYRTTVSANELAVDLDRAQYDADAGPCLSAASEGSVQGLNDMVEETAFPAFRAAAVRHGVHSSLSLPLTGSRRPAALNLYASVPEAFTSDRSRSVADLLARCVTSLLSGDRPAPDAAAEAIEAALARRSRVEQAQAMLMASGRLSRSEAFTELVQRSRQQRRSIFDIVDDVRRDGRKELS
jgi:ANTAR domain/GAF domain